MDNVLSAAVKAKVAGASSNAIVVAPQFFSTVYNLGVSALDTKQRDDMKADRTFLPAICRQRSRLG